jgi:hypothetical protein
VQKGLRVTWKSGVQRNDGGAIRHFLCSRWKRLRVRAACRRTKDGRDGTDPSIRQERTQTGAAPPLSPWRSSASPNWAWAAAGSAAASWPDLGKGSRRSGKRKNSPEGYPEVIIINQWKELIYK